MHLEQNKKISIVFKQNKQIGAQNKDCTFGASI